MNELLINIIIVLLKLNIFRKDMDYYIHKMQQRKRGIQAPGKHKAKVLVYQN